MSAHQKGLLHRCFSIFITNSEGKLLLQQRAKTKYHSGGLWTNTCCSHPRPGEKNEAAAHRRLKEEMGFDCALSEIFTFVYRAPLDHGITEHEFDHVFVGTFDGTPKPNPSEVEHYQWVLLDWLQKDVQQHPDQYTYWLKTCLNQFIEHHRKALNSKKIPY